MYMLIIHKTVTWADALTAIGTVSAVIVALFGKGIERWLTKPNLILQINKDNPITTPTTNGIPLTYLQLIIRNTKKWVARNTEVFLTSIDVDRGSAFTNIWKGEAPLLWSYINDSIPRTIGNREYRIDLLYLSHEEEKSQLHLCLGYIPLKLKAEWDKLACKACRIRLTLVICADNFCSEEYVLLVTWNGNYTIASSDDNAFSFCTSETDDIAVDNNDSFDEMHIKSSDPIFTQGTTIYKANPSIFSPTSSSLTITKPVGASVVLPNISDEDKKHASNNIDH